MGDPFVPPFAWLNPILLIFSAVAMLAALRIVSRAMVQSVMQGGARCEIPFLAVGGCVLISLALALATYALHRFVQLPAIALDREARVEAATLVKVGHEVPAFRLEALDGETIDSELFEGKVVFLSFFATWCGPCLRELPHVQEIFEAHHDREDFVLIVVGRDETEEAVAAYRKKHDFSFPMAADPEREVYEKFALGFIPRTYIISREGKVAFAATGFEEEDLETIRRTLADLLHEAE